MSPRRKTELSLVKKVAQAFRAVGKVKRAGRNATRDYPFTKASDVLAAVRDKLLAADVLIHIDEGEPQYVPVAVSNGAEQITECRLPVTYTFMDEKDALKPMRFNGIGRDVDDKSLAKAQTGAQKSLLKRFGLMVEDADEFDGDRDQTEPTGESLDDVAPMRAPRRKREQPIREFEISALQEAASRTNKSDSEIFCQFGIKTWAELKRYQFKEAIAWASNGAGTLAPKPQAVPAPVQGSLSLPTPAPPIQMRIGNKSIEFEPKDKAYSV